MFGIFKRKPYESEVDKLLKAVPSDGLPIVTNTIPMPPVKTPKKEKVIDERSQLIFFIDKDLRIQIKSKINTDIAQKLVDEGYILEGQIEDESAIQLAFILLANEATDQILDQVNEQAENFIDEN
jgi:hypothetical protein